LKTDDVTPIKSTFLVNLQDDFQISWISLDIPSIIFKCFFHVLSLIIPIVQHFWLFFSPLAHTAPQRWEKKKPLHLGPRLRGEVGAFVVHI